MSKHKGGRPPTGCPRWNPREERWEARVTLPGPGERRKLVPMPGIVRGDVDRAKKVARVIALRVQRTGAVPESTRETVAEWSDRWCADRADRGLTSVVDDRSRLNKWVHPTIGALPMADVTRAKLEDLRDHLDASIRAGALSWKTAGHAWGLVTRMFRDSVSSKRRDLRAREDNPAIGIEAPERGESKAKVYLYPAEFSQLMACADVPLQWRRFFALTVYFYARAGEVKALMWPISTSTNGSPTSTRA